MIRARFSTDTGHMSIPGLFYRMNICKSNYADGLQYNTCTFKVGLELRVFQIAE